VGAHAQWLGCNTGADADQVWTPEEFVG
jgi:hypothetical protein